MIILTSIKQLEQYRTIHPKLVYKKDFREKFGEIHEKTPLQESLFDKVESL